MIRILNESQHIDYIFTYKDGRLSFGYTRRSWKTNFLKGNSRWKRPMIYPRIIRNKRNFDQLWPNRKASIGEVGKWMKTEGLVYYILDIPQGKKRNTILMKVKIYIRWKGCLKCKFMVRVGAGWELRINCWHRLVSLKESSFRKLKVRNSYSTNTKRNEDRNW